MEKLLEYQKLDTELFRLERDINKDENRKTASSMVSFVKDAQNHILNLEKEAKNTCNDIEKLKQVQQKGVSLIEKYSKQDAEKMSEEELNDLVNKLEQTSKQLKELEHRLYSVENRTKQIMQDFDSTKKKIQVAKSKHLESKTKFDEYYKQREPEILELKKKLADLEKGLEPSVLTKYRTLKQDGIFPVIVPLTDKRCGGCRMELPMGELEKLKANGKLECPSCRRIIYVEK